MNEVIATYIMINMLDGIFKKNLVLMIWSLTSQWFTQVVFILQNVTGCSGVSRYVCCFLYSVLRQLNIAYVSVCWNARDIYTCHSCQLSSVSLKIVSPLLHFFPLFLSTAAVPRRAPTPSGAVMWQEARKHERKLRGMMVDYKRRGERRREYYEKIVRDLI